MLQTFGSFRHEDASTGPAHFFHGATGLAQSNCEARQTSRPNGLYDGLSSRRFPVFHPGIVRGHEGGRAVLPGALPPGFPATQNSPSCRFSARVLRDPDRREGTEISISFYIFADGDALNLCPGSVCSVCPVFSNFLRRGCCGTDRSSGLTPGASARKRCFSRHIKAQKKHLCQPKHNVSWGLFDKLI